MKDRKVTWSWALGLADQLIWSGCNFLSSIIAARLLGIRSFGGYAFAMAIWMVVLGLHRSLISEPLLIDPRGRVPRHVGEAAGASLTLSAFLSIAVAGLGGLLGLAGSDAFASACLALSVWVVPLLFHDLARWVAFHRKRAGLALLSDSIYFCVQATGVILIWRTGAESLPTIMGAWGVGALVAALFGSWRLAIRPRLAVRMFHREHWVVSRWLVTDFVGYYSAGQLYLFVIGWSVGPEGLGAVRAAQQLLGPVAIMIAAIQSFGLKEMAEAANRDPTRITKLVSSLSAMTVGFGLIYAVFVLGLSKGIVTRLYGAEFDKAANLVLLAALQWLVMAGTVGASLAIKATKATKFLIRPRIAVAVGNSVVALLLCRAFGVDGAAAAGLLSALTTLAVLWRTYRIHCRIPPRRSKTTSARPRPPSTYEHELVSG